MRTESEFIRLLAGLVSGELDASGLAKLDEMCESDAVRAARREAFVGAIEAAGLDDTTDAPGPTLLRAYGISSRAVPSVREGGAIGLLSLVFDSLRASPGLRSAVSSRRQLLLEADGVSLDMFVEPAGELVSVGVIVDGASAEEVSLLDESGEEPLWPDAGAWSVRIEPGVYRVVVRASGRVHETEPIQLGP